MGGKAHFGRARAWGVGEDGAAIKAGGRKQLKLSGMLRGPGQASELTGNVLEPERQGAGVPVSFPHGPLMWAREEGGGRSRKRVWPRLRFGGRSRRRSLPLGRGQKVLGPARGTKKPWSFRAE